MSARRMALSQPDTMCASKVRFRSLQHAKKCMREKHHLQGRMHAYECPLCHWVHVGHSDEKFVEWRGGRRGRLQL